VNVQPDNVKRLYDAAQQALSAIQYPDDRRTLRRASSALQSSKEGR
jgi:hypothetical protein